MVNAVHKQQSEGNTNNHPATVMVGLALYTPPPQIWLEIIDMVLPLLDHSCGRMTVHCGWGKLPALGIPVFLPGKSPGTHVEHSWSFTSMFQTSDLTSARLFRDLGREDLIIDLPQIWSPTESQLLKRRPGGILYCLPSFGSNIYAFGHQVQLIFAMGAVCDLPPNDGWFTAGPPMSCQNHGLYKCWLVEQFGAVRGYEYWHRPNRGRFLKLPGVASDQIWK